MSELADGLAVFEDATYWKSTSKLGKGFAVAYAPDAQKVTAYIAALDHDIDTPVPTGLVSLHAQGLVKMLHAAAHLAPAPPPPVSPDRTVVTDTTGQIVSADGSIWKITSGGQVSVNGTADPVTGGVAELAYVSGKVWQNAHGLWWSKTKPSDVWLPTGGTAVNPLTGTAPLHVVITGTPQVGKILAATIQ